MRRGAPPAPAADPPREAEDAARCRNCGAPLTGPYCARCGQRDSEVGVSLRVLAHDFADEYLNLDSKVLKSLVALLFRPGYLTREYLAGRRVRYVRPLRLYLVASILFLLVLSFAQPLRTVFEDDPGEPASVGDIIRILSDEQPSAPGAVPAAPGDPPIDTLAAPPEAPAAEIGAPPSVRVGPWRLDVAQRTERIRQMSPSALFDAFADRIERYLPRLMFVLLPLFALLLKLLHLRQRRYYAEHFVFSLHFHAFVFALFTLLLVLPAQPWMPLLVLWLHLYLFVAMWRVYRQSLLITGAKYFVLYFLYGLALSVTFVVSVTLILFLI